MQQIWGANNSIDELDFKQCKALFMFLKLIIAYDDKTKLRIYTRLCSMRDFRSRTGLVNRLSRDEQLEITQLLNKAEVTVQDCEREFISAKLNTKLETCNYYLKEMFETFQEIFQETADKEDMKYLEVARNIYNASRKLYDISLYQKLLSKDPDDYIISFIHSFDKWLLASYFERIIPSLILDKAHNINKPYYTFCYSQHIELTKKIRNDSNYLDKRMRFRHFVYLIYKKKSMRKIILKMITRDLFQKLLLKFGKASNDNKGVSNEDINYIFGMLFFEKYISATMENINDNTKLFFDRLGFQWKVIRFEEVVNNTKTVNMDSTKIRNVVLTAIEKVQTILLLIAPLGIIIVLKQLFVGIWDWFIATVLSLIGGIGILTIISILKYLNKCHGAYIRLKELICNKVAESFESDNLQYGYSSTEWVNWFEKEIDKLIDAQLFLQMNIPNNDM